MRAIPMFCRNLITVVLLAWGCATPALAQDTLPALETGTRVRLVQAYAPNRTVSGTVRHSTPDVLTVALPNAGTFEMSRDHLVRIDVSRGRSRGAGARKGAAVGGFLVAGMALVFAVVGTQDDFFTPIEGAVLGAGFGAVTVLPASTLIGAMVGAERWETRWRR